MGLTDNWKMAKTIVDNWQKPQHLTDNWRKASAIVMHLSMSSPRGIGGTGIGWGFWHFLKKIIKIPTPGQKIIVKISRNKWFTSHLLFKTDRSNAWCQVKIPTLGICVTAKFPWVARQSNGRSNPEVVGSIPTEVKRFFLYLVWFPDSLY